LLYVDVPYEPNQFQHISSFDQPLDLLQEISEGSSQLPLDFEPFDISGPQDTWLAWLSEGISHSLQPCNGMKLTILFYLGRNDFGQVETAHTSALQTSESSGQTNIQHRVRAADTIQDDLNGYKTLAPIQRVDPYNLLQSSMAVSSQHLTQLDRITAFPITDITGDQILPTVATSPTSMHTDQSAEPPRDSKGSIICDRVECVSVTFRTKSSWK
jgi:hypothetical protein